MNIRKLWAKKFITSAPGGEYSGKLLTYSQNRFNLKMLAREIL
jgi:hypothetical protein